jgi:hypothetical protein
MLRIYILAWNICHGPGVVRQSLVATTRLGSRLGIGLDFTLGEGNLLF